MTPEQLHLVGDGNAEQHVEYRVGKDGKRYPTRHAERRAHVEPRGEADKAMADLERLAREHAPTDAVRRWASDLDPDAARAFASAWGLVAVRRMQAAENGGAA